MNDRLKVLTLKAKLIWFSVRKSVAVSDRLKVFGSLMIVLLIWTLLRVLVGMAQTDYFPVWYGPQQVLSAGTLYGPDATADLGIAWDPQLKLTILKGNAYPLPFILAFSPFSLLPYTVAWYGLMVLGCGCIAWISGEFDMPWHRWPLLIGLNFFWFLAFLLQNITAVMVPLVLMLIWAERTDHPTVGGVLSVIIALKPQLGGVFAAIYLLREVRQRRYRALLVAGITLSALTAGSFILDPTWISGWITQIRAYNQETPLVLYPWWTYLILLGAWKRPWWVLAGLLTVFTTQLAMFYMLIVMIVYWIHRGDRFAMYGNACSLIHLSYLVSPWIPFFAPLIIDCLIMIIKDRSNAMSASAHTADELSGGP
jgi:hypothetical protein